jgi:hypothetical protein
VNPRARERRFRRLKEMGCIASWLDGRMNVPAEIHHLNLGGKAGQARRGDEATIPLSPWHHRGEPLPGYTATQMREQFGPSLARQSKAFRERYGTDDELLAKVDDIIRMRDEMASGWEQPDPAIPSLEAATKRLEALEWPRYMSEAEVSVSEG